MSLLTLMVAVGSQMWKQLLKHTFLDIDHVPENQDTPAQWIYLPDSSLLKHRWLLRQNCCLGASGYWKETHSAWNVLKVDGAAFRYTSEYAYPLNTLGKNEIVGALLKELSANRIFGLGRWGEWQHYNSDVVVARHWKWLKDYFDFTKRIDT